MSTKKISEKAQGLVEYAIILGLVAILVIVVMYFLRPPDHPCPNNLVSEGRTLQELELSESAYKLTGSAAVTPDSYTYCYTGGDGFFEGRYYRIAYHPDNPEKLFMEWHDPICTIGSEVPASNSVGYVSWDEGDWTLFSSTIADGEYCYIEGEITYVYGGSRSTNRLVSRYGLPRDQASIQYMVDLGNSNSSPMNIQGVGQVSAEVEVTDRTPLTPDLSINMGNFESPKMGYDSAFCSPNDTTYDFVLLTYTTGEFIEVVNIDDKVVVNTSWSSDVPLSPYSTVISKGIVVKNCLGRITVSGDTREISPGVAELIVPTASPIPLSLSVERWDHKDYACDLNGYMDSGQDTTAKTTIEGEWKDGLFVIKANDLVINLDIDLARGFVHYGLNGPIAPVPSGWDYDFRGETLEIFLTNGDIVMVYIPWPTGYPSQVMYKVISNLDEACNH